MATHNGRSTAWTDATLSSKFHTPDDDSSTARVSRRERWWTNGLHLVVPTHQPASATQRPPCQGVRCMPHQRCKACLHACQSEAMKKQQSAAKRAFCLFEPHQSWRLVNLWARTSSAGSQLTTTVLWCFYQLRRRAATASRARPTSIQPRPTSLSSTLYIQEKLQ